jgi:cold shock protein
MPQGIVKWFSDAKGFGFIEPDGGGEDVFAHFSAVVMDGYRSLKAGTRVSYELVEGPKGMSAAQIQSQGSPTVAAEPGLVAHSGT